MPTSRRQFLATLAGSSAILQSSNSFAANHDLTDTYRATAPGFSVSDHVNIALIGCGIIGRFDTDCALKVPGTRLVAVADLYQPRLEHAREVWGKDIFITRDFREILSRKDVDAVLICVPDFWHDHISIAALQAGKHVYCEKPMVHHIDEGQAVIDAHKKSGKVFQVGSQRASASAVLEAKKRYEAGDIGELTSVETYMDRTDALGAWQYTMPPSIDPKDLDWDRYLGDAPKRPFEAARFFRWRNYNDYGTGVAGDLFVHMVTGLHTITSSMGPERIYALGNLNYWKDGRDAYDLVTGLINYPRTEKHNAFQLSIRVNLAAGSGGNIHTRLVGTEGVLDMEWNSFRLSRLKRPTAPPYSKDYDALITYPNAMQEAFIKQYDQQYPVSKFTREIKNEPEITYKAPEGYDDRFDHMMVFFNAIRANDPSMVREDAIFGLRAAAPSLACNINAKEHKAIGWDPVRMKMS